MPQITVINPTVIHKWNIEHMLLFAGTVSPGTQNRVVSLEWGIAYIESRTDNALAAVGIIRRAMEAEEQGAGDVIINCMDDPGLYAVRKMVTIPVLGPAEASLHLAAILGHHFSVLIVLDSCASMMEEQLAPYGLSGKLASVRAFNIPVLELEKDPVATLRTLINISTCCVREDGAHVIVPGCTGLVGMAPHIHAGLVEQDCDVPVLNPTPIAMKLAETLVSLGISHNKRTYTILKTRAYQMPGVKYLTITN